MTLRSSTSKMIGNNDHNALGLHQFTVTSSGFGDSPRRGFHYRLQRYAQGDPTGATNVFGQPILERFWANERTETEVIHAPPVEFDAEGWIAGFIQGAAEQQEYAQAMAALKALFAGCSNAGLKVALAYEGIRQGIAAHVSEVMPESVGTVTVE